MSDLSEALAAWRAVEHVSALTGLSLGMLAALVALSIYVPLLRRIAIAAAITVAASYFSGMYYYGLGRTDVRKEWDAANAAAEKAARARDTNAAADLERTYGPKIAALTKEAADNKARAAAEKARADENESKIVGLLAKGSVTTASASCQLGSAAKRLRRLQ